MSATPRTLQLGGPARLAGPMREFGSSALDRRTTRWAAPDPTTIVRDPWAPPHDFALIAGAELSPWAAPLASARVDATLPLVLQPPRLSPPHPASVPISTVEPLHAVGLPDLAALARTHASMPPRRDSGVRSSIPSKPKPAPIEPSVMTLSPPTIQQLVVSDADAAALAWRDRDRSGVTAAIVAGVVATVAVASAAIALAASLL